MLPPYVQNQRPWIEQRRAPADAGFEAACAGAVTRRAWSGREVRGEAPSPSGAGAGGRRRGRTHLRLRRGRTSARGGVGPPVGEWQYPDLNNEITTLKVEAMSNSYRTFVLVWLPRREVLKRRRIIANAA